MSAIDVVRSEIVEICQRLYQRGFIAGTEGNVSVRVAPDRVWITPSGCHKGMLQADALLLIDLQGQVCLGEGSPSSELPMHLQLYRSRPDVQAVVHAHPPIATALTVARVALNTTLLPEAVVVLGDVPTVPYLMPTTWEFAQAVSESMADATAALLENHGAVAVGGSLQAAFNVMETVERAAQIFYMAHTIGRVESLTPTALAELRDLSVGDGAR